MSTILDSLVGSLARKLQDTISEEFIMILGVKEELEELKQTVNQIQCFLNDAEQRRIEESAVNHWLSYFFFFETGSLFSSLLFTVNSNTAVNGIEPGVARQGLWLLALATSTGRSV
jgi:hypothetical protein